MSGDLTQALRVAHSGLLANQQALDTVAGNVANVNTTGYSRKVINLSERTLAGHGAGVVFGTLTRRVDRDLEAAVRQETGVLKTQEVQNDALESLQQVFGTPESNTSLSHALSDFEASIEALAVNPQDALQQQDMVQKGADAARALEHSSEEVQSLRQQADRKIGDRVNEVNGLLQSVADLNEQVVRNQSVGVSVADLEDQRDKALGRLAEIIDIRTFGKSTGAVTVFTAGGQTLVDSVPVKLSHVSAVHAGAEVSYAAGDFDGVYVGDRIPANDLTQDIRTGELRGLLQLRDETLPAIQSTLDELSGKLRDNVNVVQNRGVAFPGNQTLQGTRDFRDPAAQTITFGGTTDTALVLLDANGKEVSRSTVRTLLGGNSGTINSVVTALNGSLGGNVSASLTSDNRLLVNISASGLQRGYSLALRDQADSTFGGTAQDAVIQFNADADVEAAAGVTTGAPNLPAHMDEQVSGFASFFGLNDFFVDETSTANQDSAVLASKFQYGGAPTTLYFANAAVSPTSNAAVIPSGASLDEIAAEINKVSGVNAVIVPDGSGVRLRVSANDGGPLTISEQTGTLISDTGISTSNAGSSGSIAVRSDLLSSPKLVSCGAVQWDPSVGSGRYFMAQGDDTAVQDLSKTFASFTNFSGAGRLTGTDATLVEYASSFIADTSQLASSNQSNSEYQSDLVDSLKQKSSSLSGVNLDEEVSNLMQYEQAYTAAARVISVVQEMFQALERTIG